MSDENKPVDDRPNKRSREAGATGSSDAPKPKSTPAEAKPASSTAKTENKKAAALEKKEVPNRDSTGKEIAQHIRSHLIALGDPNSNEHKNIAERREKFARWIEWLETK